MGRTAPFEAESIIPALRADGVVICENVLDSERVADMHAELDSILENTPEGRNEFEGYSTRRIYNLFGKTRCFDDLAVHSVMLDVVESMIGQAQLSAPTGIQIGPGEPAQVWHHDDSIYPLPEPHDEVVLNTMWALDDFTVDNGATRFVTGSHRWDSDRPPSDADPVDHAVMPAGSVAFYTGSIRHGGGANTTDRPRLGVILEYAAAWLRPQENHIVGVRPELMATLSSTLQELLGYNIYPPFLGYVDGRHPQRFLPHAPNSESSEEPTTQ